MANIIIRKPGNYGRTRSEQESNLRKEWGPTVSDEQLDKIKFIEKRVKEAVGSAPPKVNPSDADHLK